MQTNHYIVDDEGNFRFTSVGLEEEGPLLARAGIDPTSIKTYEAYIQARKTAGPYFMDYLRDETDRMLEGKPDTVEWQAIRSIAFGSDEEQKALIEKMKRFSFFAGVDFLNDAAAKPLQRFDLFPIGEKHQHFLRIAKVRLKLFVTCRFQPVVNLFP